VKRIEEVAKEKPKNAIDVAFEGKADVPFCVANVRI